MDNPSSSIIVDAIVQAFQGMFVGDSTSMPVHWYYDVPAIKRDYNGWIAKYEKPNDNHPTSILKKSNRGGSGTGDNTSDDVIGNVILHDKLEAWTENATKNHYHQGMQAGDSTLNCHCALNVMTELQKVPIDYSDEDMLKAVFKGYVDFITTPNTHNDTYAESWHRLLFADWINEGKPKKKDELYDFLTRRSDRVLTQNEDTQLNVIGAFVVPIPLILHNINRPLQEVTNITLEFMRRTHPVTQIIEPMETFVRILHSVVRGGNLKVEAENALIAFLGKAGKFMINSFDKELEKSSDKLSLFQKFGAQLGIACYIDGSFAVLLNIARCFWDDFEGGILVNANTGGENCHRGAALGALLGASSGSCGQKIPPQWLHGLQLEEKIDACTVGMKI